MTPVDRIDALMDTATRALMAMDYPRCERQCLEALELARQQRNWDIYARVVLPLQEARRQRRMTAAEGHRRLGTASLEGNPTAWLAQMPEGGCLVLTEPHRREQARELSDLAAAQGRAVEVLWADNPMDAPRWQISSLTDSELSVIRPAPPEAWRDRWIEPGQSLPAAPPVPGSQDATGQSTGGVQNSATPTDWVMDAMEALGDQALASLTATEDTGDRLAQLEACVIAAPDHEILHQRLAETARQLHRAADT